MNPSGNPYDAYYRAYQHGSPQQVPTPNAYASLPPFITEQLQLQSQQIATLDNLVKTLSQQNNQLHHMIETTTKRLNDLESFVVAQTRERQRILAPCDGQNCTSKMDIDESFGKGRDREEEVTKMAVLQEEEVEDVPDTSRSESEESSEIETPDQRSPSRSPTPPRPDPKHDPASSNPAYYTFPRPPTMPYATFLTHIRARNLFIKTENRTNYNINPDCTLYALLAVRTGRAVINFPSTIRAFYLVGEDVFDRIMDDIGVSDKPNTLPAKRRLVLNATVAGLK